MTQPSFKTCPGCGQRIAYFLNMCHNCASAQMSQSPTVFYQPAQPKLHPAVLIACILLSVACVWYIGGSLWAGYQLHKAQAEIQAAQDQQQQDAQQRAEHDRQENTRFYGNLNRMDAGQPIHEASQNTDANNRQGSFTTPPFPGSGGSDFGR